MDTVKFLQLKILELKKYTKNKSINSIKQTNNNSVINSKYNKLISPVRNKNNVINLNNRDISNKNTKGNTINNNIINNNSTNNKNTKEIKSHLNLIELIRKGTKLSEIKKIIKNRNLNISKNRKNNTNIYRSMNTNLNKNLNKNLNRNRLINRSRLMNRKGLRNNLSNISLISPKIHRHVKSFIEHDTNIFKDYNIAYNFTNNFKKFKLNSFLIYSFLNLGVLISKPVIYFTQDKVVINLFYYTIKKTTNLIKKTTYLNYLCTFLSKKIEKPVTFDLIRLYHPSLDSQILSQTIGYISKDRRIKFRTIVLKIFHSVKIFKFEKSIPDFKSKYFNPTGLLGIKVRLGGHIPSKKVVPRLTTATKKKGTFARTKTDFSTTSRYTDKGKRGSYSLTVTVSHKFF